MNSQKITGTSMISCICSNCQTILHHPKDEIYIDIDDKTYAGFYCSACKLIKEAGEFTPGTQIIYLPPHANGIYSKDAERGFVTSVSVEQKIIFCRFWSNHHDGLRTTANSEATPIDRMVIKETVPQEKVDELMKELYSNTLNDKR